MSLHVDEWPQEAIPYMTGKIIQTSIMIREITGCSMIPSPDPAAHVRHDSGTSQHSTDNKTKKSTATDQFLNNGQVATFWVLAQTCPDLGGFGLYFDTRLNGKKRVMAHLDNRKDRMLWLCPDQEKREYIYYHKEPSRYLQVLGEQFKLLGSWK
jgi:hypothetical protein